MTEGFSEAHVAWMSRISSPTRSKALTRMGKVSPTVLTPNVPLSAIEMRTARCRTSMRTLSAMPRSLQRTYVTPFTCADTSPLTPSVAIRSFMLRHAVVRSA